MPSLLLLKPPTTKEEKREEKRRKKWTKKWTKKWEESKTSGTKSNHILISPLLIQIISRGFRRLLQER